MPATALRPYLLGTGTGSGVSTIAITTGLPVNTGDTVIICTDTDPKTFVATPTSVTDTAGNTYTLVSLPAYTINPYLAVWVAQNATAMPAGSTINVNWSRNIDIDVVAVGCAGLDPGNAVDQIAWDYTTAGAMSLSTGQLGLSTELVIAYWVARQAQGGPQITSDWNSFAAFQGAANTHWVNVAWQAETRADPVTANAGTPAAGTGWSGALISFRGRIYPSAMLSCGGSLSAMPVQAVNGTAALHGGGSLLGPDEMAPVPPPRSPAFIAGYGPLPADMENLVRNPFRWVSEQAVYRGQASGAGQAISASTFTPLAFGTPLEDPWGGWSSTSTSEQATNSWLCPWTGLYRVTFRWLGGTAGAWSEAAIGVSGVNPVFEAEMAQAPTGITGGAEASVVLPLVGGADYVQALAWSSASVTTDTSVPGRCPSMEITCVQADLLG
jgi:hypothetical protein